MRIDKKFALTVSISILVTFLVYIGIVTSLETPTLIRTPISKEKAILIVINNRNLTSSVLQNFFIEFIHIKGYGLFYESILNTNHVGIHLSDFHPSIINSNYFLCKIRD